MSGIPSDAERVADLTRAYDFDAAARDKRDLSWRAPLLDRWTSALAAGSRLIELGAGTGQAARHVADMGFDVLAIDLSTENVARCRQRGVAAIVGDMADLGSITDPAFDPPYDAAFAINSLIHFPKAGLAKAVASIRSALRPGGELMFTLWGGRSSEGHWEEDWTEPKRFFSFYDEDEARALRFPGFHSERFSTLDNRDKLDLYTLIIEMTAG